MRLTGGGGSVRLLYIPHGGICVRSFVMEKHEHRKRVINRMSRAIGHMQAIKTMLENDRDCSDVLIQLSAVRSEINGIGKSVLKDHLSHCIADAVKSGDGEVLEKLNAAVDKLL